MANMRAMRPDARARAAYSASPPGPVGKDEGVYRIGSAWPITRLIDGARSRKARSSASTFSCTA